MLEVKATRTKNDPFPLNGDDIKENVLIENESGLIGIMKIPNWHGKDKGMRVMLWLWSPGKNFEPMSMLMDGTNEGTKFREFHGTITIKSDEKK